MGYPMTRSNRIPLAEFDSTSQARHSCKYLGQRGLVRCDIAHRKRDRTALEAHPKELRVVAKKKEKNLLRESPKCHAEQRGSCLHMHIGWLPRLFLSRL